VEQSKTFCKNHRTQALIHPKNGKVMLLKCHHHREYTIYKLFIGFPQKIFKQ